MPDREKVIKGFEDIIKEETYPDRPRRFMMPLELAEQILALLKEQEELLHKKQYDINKLCNEISEWKHKFYDKPLKEQEAVEPICQIIFDVPYYFCGSCKTMLNMYATKAKYCSNCARRVKWK